MTGRLTLVGVGPGDPELITLKAIKAIQIADVLVYPQKPGEKSLALSIAQEHVLPSAELMPINVPMKVDRAPAQAAYDEISTKIETALNAGMSVAYLCEGDPLFYGSAMYLIDRLDGFQVDVVPGITSLTATAASIVRPLAARNETLKVLPAPLDDEKLKAELSSTPSAAIIKVGRHFDRVRDLLKTTGHASNAIIVEYATQDTQKITPLLEYAPNERPYFSTILCYNGDEKWGR